MLKIFKPKFSIMKKLILGIGLLLSFFLLQGQNHFNALKNANPTLAKSRNYISPKVNNWVKQYLASNLKYPELAEAYGVEGDVRLLVQVLETGKVGSVQVLKGLGLGLDEEAIRLVKNMPPWSAAIRDGISIDSNIKMTISFRL